MIKLSAVFLAEKLIKCFHQVIWPNSKKIAIKWNEVYLSKLCSRTCISFPVYKDSVGENIMKTNETT